MNTFPMDGYERLNDLRHYERYLYDNEFPMKEVEFWSIFQRGLEIRMGAAS